MRRLFREPYTFRFSRLLILRPEATLDPLRYPLGYVPLDDSEPIDNVYSLIRAGHFVAPLNNIETIHKVYIGVRSLCQSEYPLVGPQDIVISQVNEKELISRILIRRDFWVLDDFNNPELNQSFGVQNYYFDNYKWSQFLYRRFQLFAEEYYPISEHSHLQYVEYIELIKSFFVFEEGASVYPLLPKAVKLHPPYGIMLPSRSSLEPIMLLKQWLENFRPTLGLNRALVVNCGPGVVPFTLKYFNVPIVRGADPRPRAISSCRKDATTHHKLSGISFQTAELFPPLDDFNPRKYDIIVFYPDEEIVSSLTDYASKFAPGMQGVAGRLEEFFEKASDFLSETGVIAICCTNLRSILNPSEPHLIEYEIKQNRRFVLLDYYDAPIRYGGFLRHQFSGPKVSVVSSLKKKMRSELWILHKITSIHKFGFFHQIPGAKPPPQSHEWGRRKASLQRQKHLKNYVEMIGGDWNDYKKRLIHMLQESTDEPEDDVAEAVRMALDPTYPLHLSQLAKLAIEENLKEKAQFDHRVLSDYLDKSPRESFDSKFL
ncbi:unnamed protein product [Phytomonas sp. Hart1]|nr:unnamed protein product [Phytomonas sp. Hart1]|eukprot:CCW68789.1 unnamed protein product [Phytomonas sp. isolate Hart1]